MLDIICNPKQCVSNSAKVRLWLWIELQLHYTLPSLRTPNIFDSVWHRCQNQNASCTNCTLVKTFWLLYDDGWLDCSSISCLNHDLNLNAYTLHYMLHTHVIILILTYVLKHNKNWFSSNIVCFPIYLWIFWVTALKATLVRSRWPSSTKSESILRQRWAKVYEGFPPKMSWDFNGIISSWWFQPVWKI